MPSRFVRFSLILLLAFCVSSAGSPLLLAQTNTTGLAGVITDPSGAVVPQAAVEITNPATGYIRVVKSGAKGDYSFDQIAPGSYTVTVSAPNFAPQSEQVELLVATPSKLNFKLTVGATEVVDVETSIAQLNTTDATLGKAFNSAQVQNLPYLANNVTYLLSLQPGVLALDSGAQTGGLNTDTRTGIVNGARQDQTNITLDGVDNNDQIFGYAFNGALRSTRDSVEEFRVTTTNANADAGRSSGAQVSLVTRSGTNSIHGSAYEYYRSSVGASNNWYNKQSELSSGLGNIPAKILEHTYGASLGLPIIKDKLFFFGAYEGFKQASDIEQSQTVPSVFGGGGLYTGNVTYQACPNNTPCQTSNTLKTLTPTDIAQLDGRASDPACATTACAAPAKDDAAIAYFKLFPAANAPGALDPYNTGIYNFTSPAPLHQITNISRIDYNISSRQLLYVRGNLQSDNQSAPLQFPGQPPSAAIYGNNKGIAVGHTWTLNDHLTNNFHYGLTRIGNATRGTGSQPYTIFGPISTLTGTTTDTVYLVRTNNFTDDLTYVKGKHVIQVGVNLDYISNGQYFNAPLTANQVVSPNLLATAAIANQGGSYDPGAFSCPDCAPVASNYNSSYNNAIISNIGAIEQAQSGTEFSVQGSSLVPLGQGVVPTHTYKNVEQEYYVQDQWKVTSRLTLTGGIRYVYLGTPYEEHGQQIAPAISLNTFLGYREAAAAAGTGYDTDIAFRASGSPNGQPNFWTPNKYNFAPRFAFAYATPDNKTSARGGFAISYDHYGSGIIDTYQSSGSALFSLSQINQGIYNDINSSPRFTGYGAIQSVTGATSPLSLPYTPAENPFTFLNTINDRQKTPYAETFNLTLEHQLPHSLDVTASYVGRLGRHLVQSLDVAMPTNVYDSGSNMTYFEAAKAYDVLVDNNVQSVPDTGYFHDLFPNFSYNGLTGASAYYALFAANRGNETNALYAADCAPQASCDFFGSNTGPSWTFFFPQTSSIYAQSTIGTSNYNALQLSVRQALKYGLEYDVNYTYSKSLDEGSDPERKGAGNASPVENTFSPKQWYGPSDFDVRHNITANYTAPIPIGEGAPFLNTSNFLGRLIGGFQLNGVVHYSTGFPFSAIDGNQYSLNFAISSNMVQTGPIPTGGHRYDAPNQTETALKGSEDKALANLRYAYVGESGQRNNFRSDGYLSLDDGLSKAFKTFREQKFRVSVEVFNVLNTNRFSVVQNAGNSPNFGVYINSNTSPALLLQPRQMQFSGKYIAYTPPRGG
jgi:hypothetical protein